jgi:NAD(P)-dependent dehydrogenase (short-subunit alcohol dehydrogenase family)
MRMFTGDQFSLEGKVALVTGVGARKHSIGEAYAMGLLNQGAKVIVVDLSKEGAETAAHELSKLGDVAAFGADVADAAAVEAMIDAAGKRWGGLDILVNNAALMVEMTRAAVLDVPNSEWDRMMQVNLMGAVNCSRSITPLLRARGGGRIVNQVSRGAFPAESVYGITKLALVGLTTALARNLGKDRITVNAIAPGNVASEAGRMLTQTYSPELQAFQERLVALRVEGAPDELVGALLMLVSQAGSWITGQVLHVDGGFVLRP